MSRFWLALTLALVVAATAPLAAVPDPPGAAPPDAPAVRLAALRAKDPALYAHRMRDARAFFALPAEEQDRLRQFDRDLHQEPSSAQANLKHILARYADWLDRLPPDDRRQVVEAPDRFARLGKIRLLREEQWVRRQPKRVRHQLANLRTVRPALRLAPAVLAPQTAFAFAFAAGPLLAPGTGARDLAIARLRQEERKRRQAWQIALRLWTDLKEGKAMPARVADLSEAARKFVSEYLLPMLSQDERERLEKAEGAWPQFPQALVEIADRHPVALPGPHGPTTFKQLPTDLQARLLKATAKGPKAEQNFRNLLKKAEGRWPGFALAVTDFAARRSITMPNELWPSRLRDLSPPVQRFLREKLLPSLDGGEKKLLRDKEGKWPEYPQTIQELAVRHYLKVPWLTLPGRSEEWDAYRFKRQSAIERVPQGAPADRVALPRIPTEPDRLAHRAGQYAVRRTPYSVLDTSCCISSTQLPPRRISARMAPFSRFSHRRPTQTLDRGMRG